MDIISKAIHYGEAVIKHAIDGFTNVPEDVEKERLDTCLSCPLLVKGECGICGCPVESKVKWASESCPAHPSRWGTYKESMGLQKEKATSQSISDQPVAPVSQVSAKGGKGVCGPCEARKRKRP